jgi:phage gp29-like protein
MSDYITTRAGLVVPAAAFEEAAAEKPELQEIATIDRDYTKAFFGATLQNDDDTLITRGGGKGLKIYDELERDAHAYAMLQKRKLALISREVVVTAASKDAQDELAAEFVTEVLGSIQFDRICVDLLDATSKGFSVGEIMWAVKPSATLGHEVVMPRDVIARNQRRFTFGRTRDEKTGEHPLRLLTREQMIEGVELPDRKFIVHRFGAKDGSPFGLGLGNKLFWPVFFKRQGIGFWLTFADKFGAPTAIGKYPRGANSQEQRKLLQALRAIANDVGIIVPDGTAIELLEAARSGSIDTYERLARYMDEQISVCVTGETMTSNAQGAGLGSGQANVQNEVRTEVTKADADLLTDTLTTFVAWIVDYNLPGARSPKVTRNFDEEEDLNHRAERDVKIGELGYEPDENYILTTYGPGWKKKAAPPPSPFGTPLGVDPAQFAEVGNPQLAANHAAQEAMATAAAAFSEKWADLVGQRLEEITALLDDSGDLVTFRERLAELLDAAPPKEMVDALARAGFAANLNARADRTRA